MREENEVYSHSNISGLGKSSLRQATGIEAKCLLIQFT